MKLDGTFYLKIITAIPFKSAAAAATLLLFLASLLLRSHFSVVSSEGKEWSKMEGTVPSFSRLAAGRTVYPGRLDKLWIGILKSSKGFIAIWQQLSAASFLSLEQAASGWQPDCLFSGHRFEFREGKATVALATVGLSCKWL
jgi:hypothetical protein